VKSFQSFLEMRSDVHGIRCNGCRRGGRCRRRRRCRRSVVGQRQRVSAVVEEPPEGELVEAVRVLALLVVRIGVVVHQPGRVDRVEVGGVGLVQDFRLPRRSLHSERLRKVDAVQVGVLLDVLGAVGPAESRGSVGAKSPDQILGLE